MRDRGRGFDPAAVPGDRKRLAESVRARMVRRGVLVGLAQCPPGRHRGVLADAARRRPCTSAEPGTTASSPSGPAGGGRGVFIVDDHGLFRAGVRAELGDQVQVVGEADEGPAIAQITASLPDVVLLDVHLPTSGGQAVVSSVKAAHPEVRSHALISLHAPEDVIAVIRAGARGYVTKTISTAELVDAVRRVAAGERSSPLCWPGSSWTPSPGFAHRR